MYRRDRLDPQDLLGEMGNPENQELQDKTPTGEKAKKV